MRMLLDVLIGSTDRDGADARPGRLELCAEVVVGAEEQSREDGAHQRNGHGGPAEQRRTIGQARGFPDALSRLVLLSPIGLWRDDAPIRLVEMVTGPPEELPSYLFKYPESEAAQAMMALPDDPDQVPAAIAQGAWNVGCTTKFAWPIADHGLARRLHRIAVPTLVLWGRDDALVPVIYAEEFAGRIPGSRVEVLEDCGHAMQGDQPAQMLQAITEFLA